MGVKVKYLEGYSADISENFHLNKKYLCNNVKDTLFYGYVMECRSDSYKGYSIKMIESKSIFEKNLISVNTLPFLMRIQIKLGLK